VHASPGTAGGGGVGGAEGDVQGVGGLGELVDEVARVGPDVEVGVVVGVVVGERRGGRAERLLLRGRAGGLAVGGPRARSERVERYVGRPLAPGGAGGRGRNGGGVLRAETEQPRLDSGRGEEVFMELRPEERMPWDSLR
jgi:hypothetical protein